MKIIGKKEYLNYNKYFNNISFNVAEENENYSYNANYKEINNKHDKLFRDLLNDKEEMVLFLEKYLKIKFNKMI